jgi:MFS family permease
MKPSNPIRANNAWLAVSLILCLISGSGASFIQTAGGSITVKDLRWETPSGHMMSALLFKPDTASIESPAPAVVVSHGWFNNREMQDLNYVELSRRGYVTLSIDMYGHGHSEALAQAQLYQRGIGMYDAVELVASLPYVDSSRIGVSGHSNGALAANLSVAEDSLAESPLIAAVLLVDRDPVYRNTTTNHYENVYGDRDVGLIQDDYDEFFFRSTDAEGTVLTPPREYLSTDNAQSFLNFGAAPIADQPRKSGEIYRKRIDGKEAIRVIYSLDQIHPWTHFSADAARDQVQFFAEVFGAPNPIDATSQVWQVRSLFTFLGLVGFAVFLVSFSRSLLGLALFSELRPDNAVAIDQLNSRSAHTWFWSGLIILAIISGVSYIGLFPVAFITRPDWLPQGAPYFIGLWAAVNGLAILAFTSLSYYLHGRKEGQNLRENGVIIGWRQLVLSILLSGIVVVAAFLLVFLVDFLFKSDFRLWVLTVRTFTLDKIWIALLYLPLFLIYFMASAIALNCFNRFTLHGREWLNTAVLVLFTVLAPVVLIVAQYSTFFSTGYTLAWFPGISSIWLFPVIVYLGVSVFVSRKIYRATGNPYVGGMVNAAVLTMISVSNTLTMG